MTARMNKKGGATLFSAESKAAAAALLSAENKVAPPFLFIRAVISPSNLKLPSLLPAASLLHRHLALLTERRGRPLHVRLCLHLSAMPPSLCSATWPPSSLCLHIADLPIF
mmetsp:Transcript_7982/g.13688  ORF Transcript_7982/g.13688 Transcript_7982/m.13688 type:complete len:111 (+) Transcript_7982:1307-1639(+)